MIRDGVKDFILYWFFWAKFSVPADQVGGFSGLPVGLISQGISLENIDPAVSRAREGNSITKQHKWRDTAPGWSFDGIKYYVSNSASLQKLNGDCKSLYGESGSLSFGKSSPTFPPCVWYPDIHLLPPVCMPRKQRNPPAPVDTFTVILP